MGDAGFERVTSRHSIDFGATKLAALFRASQAAPKVQGSLTSLSSFQTS
jgi:hypothetical protein